MNIFSHLDVAPKIHYASSKLGVIIMEYVNAIPDWWYRQPTPHKLNELSFIFNQMDKTHYREPTSFKFFPNRRLKDIYQQVDYICNIQYPSDTRFNEFRKVLKEFHTLQQVCNKIAKFTICHHDFHVWNVLYKHTGTYKVIDFEFSGSGDRFSDIASIAIFMRLKKDEEHALLVSYLGASVSKFDLNKYYLFKHHTWLHYIIIGLGICEKYDFPVKQSEIEELPAFNDFSPHTKLSVPINPHSDIWHYKSAYMLIKQADIYRQQEEYQESLKYFCEATLPFNRISY